MSTGVQYKMYTKNVGKTTTGNDCQRMFNFAYV